MNKSLPIYEYRDEIVAAISNNAVTIISAETGSGKSTQVCQYLYEEGYEVVVTEPRRLAARTVAERVAEETGVKLGEVVGYRTAFEREYSKDTKILFCTDGLQLVRELTDGNAEGNRVLIIDEVHEWNLNIETLVAWAKLRVEEGWLTKVVIMSATMETEKLREYFGEAALLNIPGRMYPVKKTLREKGELISTISSLVSEGKNVLTFVAGKKEINEVIQKLTELDVKAAILPLHGELSPEEQKACFREYAWPKVVVATNVAQTSVTVPDIDAVVDTGLERRVDTDSYGVSGLFLNDISKADCDQRAGRAGRTKAGEYYLCSHIEYDGREEHPVAEMQRSILDQVVLRLAAVGIDATQLKFFHQPSEDALNRAYKSLTTLGALQDGRVTEMGLKMSRIPLSAKYSRMIIEAEKYGVVEDVITIAAILECGSLVDHRSGKSYGDFSQEKKSDLLAELDIWNWLQTFRYIEFKEEGINGKNFFRIKELRNKLIETLSSIVEFGTVDDRELVKKACFAGLLDNFFASNYGVYKDAYGVVRHLDRKSVVNKSFPKLLVGKPMTIEYKDKWLGFRDTMELICMATEVEHEWLEEIAPHLLTVKDSAPEYSASLGCYVWRMESFNGVSLGDHIVETPDHPKAQQLKEEYEERRRWAERQYGFSSFTAYRDTRQKKVNVDGYCFDVEYGWDDKPYIVVMRGDLKNITAKTVKLDDGTLVTIRCGNSSMNNFPALRTKVQNEMIAEARKEVWRDLDNISSANEAVVTGWFDKLGKKFIVTTLDGEEIYEHVYLTLKDKLISIGLTADEELACSETDAAIRFLFGKIVKSKYPDKKFVVKKGPNKKKTLTEEKELFDDLVREAADGLSVENFSERINMLDEFFKELMG